MGKRKTKQKAAVNLLFSRMRLFALHLPAKLSRHRWVREWGIDRIRQVITPDPMS